MIVFDANPLKFIDSQFFVNLKKMSQLRRVSFKRLGCINILFSSYNNVSIQDFEWTNAECLNHIRREQNIIKYEQVDADCSCLVDLLDGKKKYICIIWNILNQPNIRIDSIITSHKNAKSDEDVQDIYIESANLYYKVTFPNGYLREKFINAKGVLTQGKKLTYSYNSIKPYKF